MISIFSCSFSGLLLFLAIRAPRYGKHITSQGPLTPSDAILLTTIVGKVVELTFIASFVAFLGQVLSRRAFMKADGRGVTLSELSMWRWVVQPGTIVTHWETTKFAGLTLLGMLSLLSTILATFYGSSVAALGIDLTYRMQLDLLTNSQFNQCLQMVAGKIWSWRVKS